MLYLILRGFQTFDDMLETLDPWSKFFLEHVFHKDSRLFRLRCALADPIFECPSTTRTLPSNHC